MNDNTKEFSTEIRWQVDTDIFILRYKFDYVLEITG